MDDSAVHDLTCPESVGLCIPFFYYMWLNTSKRHKGRKTALLDDEVAFKINIPDTIVYNFQKPQHWYFTSRSSDAKERGTIRRRKRINMSSQRIIEHFLPPRSKSGIAAVVLSTAAPEGEFDQQPTDPRKEPLSSTTDSSRASPPPHAHTQHAITASPTHSHPHTQQPQRHAPEEHALAALSPEAQSVIARVHNPPPTSTRVVCLPPITAQGPIPPDATAAHGANRATTVHFLDDLGMRQHVERSIVQAGVLQPFIDPRAGSDEVVRAAMLTARWQPAPPARVSTQYELVESLLPLFPKDGKPWSDTERRERAESVTAPLWRTRVTPLISRIVAEEVCSTCDNVAAHLREVADVVVRSMTLHFVIDAKSTLWLSYCSALSVLPAIAGVPPPVAMERTTASLAAERQYRDVVEARRELIQAKLYGRKTLGGMAEVAAITHGTRTRRTGRFSMPVPPGVDPHLAQFATRASLRRLAAAAEGAEPTLLLSNGKRIDEQGQTTTARAARQSSLSPRPAAPALTQPSASGDGFGGGGRGGRVGGGSHKTVIDSLLASPDDVFTAESFGIASGGVRAVLLR